MISCAELLSYLNDFLDGELDPELHRRVLEHCRACSPCNVLVDTTRNTLRFLDNDEIIELPEGVSQRLHARLQQHIDALSAAHEAGPKLVSPASEATRGRSWVWGLAMAALMTLLVIFGGLHLHSTAAHMATLQGWLVDQHCAAKYADHPQDHYKACALSPECLASGLGVMLSGGDYVRFDKAGSDEAARQLREANVTTDLRVLVRGMRKGDMIQVRQLSLDMAPSVSVDAFPDPGNQVAVASKVLVSF